MVEKRANVNASVSIEGASKVVESGFADVSNVSERDQLHSHISCVGIRFYDILPPPDHYEFLLHYPACIHQTALPKGVRIPTWSFHSDGKLQ